MLSRCSFLTTFFLITVFFVSVSVLIVLKREEGAREVEIRRYEAGLTRDAVVYRANAEFNKHLVWAELAAELLDKLAPGGELERLNRSLTK
jgi:hypothetical protein